MRTENGGSGSVCDAHEAQLLALGVAGASLRQPAPAGVNDSVARGRTGTGTLYLGASPRQEQCLKNGAQIMPDRLFRDRRDAGRYLAGLLLDFRDRPDVIVLGLPRGGVPAAYEVATALGAPLDVFLVRKLGVPGREELAMGAIASGGGNIRAASCSDASRPTGKVGPSLTWPAK